MKNEKVLSPNDKIVAERRGKKMESRVGKQTKNEFNVFFRGMENETGGKKFKEVKSEYHDTRVLQKQQNKKEDTDVNIEGRDVEEYIKYCKLKKAQHAATLNNEQLTEEKKREIVGDEVLGLQQNNLVLEAAKNLAATSFRQQMKFDLKVQREHEAENPDSGRKTTQRAGSNSPEVS